MNTGDTSESQSGKRSRQPLAADALMVQVPDCTACAACMNGCPSNAISMPLGEDGFHHPQIDPSACIGCRHCFDICPVNNEAAREALKDKLPSRAEPRAWFGWSENREVRLASSSGGIFTELARLVFARGGCCFGVVQDERMHPRFARAENMEELAAMRGSKYLQSYVGTAYREVRQELRQGRMVLFTGTPCQAGALRAYLKKDYDNLLVADIVCHGVPSYKLMEKYLQETEAALGQRVNSIFYRDVREGWTRYNYGLRLELAGGGEHYSPAGADAFMRGYLSGLFLSPGCSHCRFVGVEKRLADLTMGDAWGIWDYRPEVDSRDGVSLLVAYTRKGAEILQSLPGVHLEEVDVETGIRQNPSIARVTASHPRRAEALSLLPHTALADIVRKCAVSRPPFFRRVCRKLKKLFGKG